jgi:hypothetical protein
LVEGNKRLVPFRDDFDRQRPGETKPGIVMPDSEFVCGRIKPADEVTYFCSVPKRLETVCEPLRDVNGAVILFRKPERDMLQESRAFGAEIDNDIKDFAACATHKFRFCRWWKLEVHAPQGALGFVERDVSLVNGRLHAVGREFLPAERARKISTIVLALFEIDHKGTFEPRLGKDQIRPQVLNSIGIFSPKAAVLSVFII